MEFEMVGLTKKIVRRGCAGVFQTMTEDLKGCSLADVLEKLERGRSGIGWQCSGLISTLWTSWWRPCTSTAASCQAISRCGFRARRARLCGRSYGRPRVFRRGRRMLIGFARVSTVCPAMPGAAPPRAGQLAAGDVLMVVAARPSGPLDPRPPEHPCRDRRPQGRLPIPGRRLGRPHDRHGLA